MIKEHPAVLLFLIESVALPDLQVHSGVVGRPSDMSSAAYTAVLVTACMSLLADHTAQIVFLKVFGLDGNFKPLKS